MTASFLATAFTGDLHALRLVRRGDLQQRRQDLGGRCAV